MAMRQQLIAPQTGHSVLLHVTDFLHYLYVAAPISFTKTDCEPFKAYLETQLSQREPTIASVQLLLRENLFGFQGNQKSPYIKITVTDPKFINRLRTSIESGNANYKGLWKGAEGGILTFDSLQYVLRFMVDCGVCFLLFASSSELTSTLDIRHVLGGGTSWQIPHDTRQRPSFQLSNRGIHPLPRSNRA